MDINAIQPYIRSASRFSTWNYHNNFNTIAYDHRLFYISGSSCIMMINNVQYNITDGTIVYIPSGNSYNICNSNPAKTISLLCINFDFSYSQSHIKSFIPTTTEEMFDSNNLIERIDDPVFGKPIIMEGSGIYHKDIMQIIDEYTNHMMYYEGYISSVLKRILTELARKFNTGTTEHGNNNIYRVLQYISLNYMNNITNKSIADELFYHPYYLSNLIKRHTGMTMHRYIMNYRIEKALQLIISSNLSYNEIAVLSGFKTQSHFTKCFKRITGKLPSDYRTPITAITTK